MSPAGLRLPCDSAIAAAQDLPAESTIQPLFASWNKRVSDHCADRSAPAARSCRHRGAKNHAGPADNQPWSASRKKRSRTSLVPVVCAAQVSPRRRTKNDPCTRSPSRLADELNAAGSPLRPSSGRHVLPPSAVATNSPSSPTAKRGWHRRIRYSADAPSRQCAGDPGLPASVVTIKPPCSQRR